MNVKTKNALIFGGFICLNSILASVILKVPILTTSSISSLLIVAIVLCNLFGFVLKGSFGWKNKKEDITK